MSPIAVPQAGLNATAGPSTSSLKAQDHRPRAVPTPKSQSPAHLPLVRHSHFLDLSETEGVRTPRPATLTPSPPMRHVDLPDVEDGDGEDEGGVGEASGPSSSSSYKRSRGGNEVEAGVCRAQSTRSVLGRGRGRVGPDQEGEAARLLRTIDFAARKHTCQRRKDLDQTPYINHPIAVANFLSSTGITDIRVMQAAVLHDTVEDTHTTIDEIRQHFGPKVASIVAECTDDSTLSGQARKLEQVRSAPMKSREAQQVKLADKLHNLESIRRCPPVGWTARRVQAYFTWAKQVTDLCSAAHPPLAERLQRLYETAYTEIDGQYFKCHPDACGTLTDEEKQRIDHRLQCLKKGEKPLPMPIFF